jgi:hypothetical protein
MSWGFYADLQLALPTATWKEIGEQRPSETVLTPGWSGLADKALEAEFAKPFSEKKTFAQLLASPAYKGAQTINTVKRTKDATRVRICVLLDKSTLELAYPLVALLHSAREAGTGALRLVNDGTYGGEGGAVITLAKGKLTSKRVKDCWPLVEELGQALLATSPGVNPFAKYLKAKKS